jgi:acyl phosphate:glycerol-3-phosphate acyltransferase
MSLLTLVTLALAFALGGVLGGRVMGALRGVDLRRAGSGNIGATNALRTQGKSFAIAVLLIDAGKGVLAALLLPALAARFTATPAWLPVACGALAVLGHCYSPWFGFNGGKGVATLAGVFLALLPVAFGWMFAAFALLVLLTGVVSLATLAAAFTAALLAWQVPPALPFACPFTLLMLALVLWAHRDNWRRLLKGEESRFERARLLGRWLRLPPLGRAREAQS